MLTRPEQTEYVSYYQQYIDKVPDGAILDTLERQVAHTLELLSGIDDKKANHRYASDKWSIKQLVGHVVDIERIFCYRALTFARNDKTPLPSFEQDDYVAGSNYDDQTLAVIADQLRVTRSATLAMFRSFDDETWLRTGVASGFEFSVQAIPYILAGHEIHHIGVLKERYL